MISPMLLSVQKRPSAHEREFCGEVLRGLSSPQKSLPCKYFYDRRGSQLFDRICELPEYYPTRTERRIMQEHAPEMAAAMGSSPLLIELGSGSSLKTRLLLSHLSRPAAYFPIDISKEHLFESAQKIASEFPDLEIKAVHADFTHAITLPPTETAIRRKVVYFPGSTIGNFETQAAEQLLGQISHLAGPGGQLLIGFDLQKDQRVLEAAYNDSQQVTADFNKNLLRRINRELDADFELHQFEHQAIYNRQAGRIEMHLVSKVRQRVHIAGQKIHFEPGETICTEHSHKYQLQSFTEMAAKWGLKLRQTWTDDKQYFCVAMFDNQGKTA